MGGTLTEKTVSSSQRLDRRAHLPAQDQLARLGFGKRGSEALLAYVQVRALVGGTTSIQGWPPANRPHQTMLRNIDDEKAGTTNRNLIYTSALTEKPLDLAKTAQFMSHGAGFIYHCSEGQRGSIVAREFKDVAASGCLQKKLLAIHCNAVADSDWPLWRQSDAGAVVWSPFSNLWLYGTTTNLPAPISQGVSICLGSDWGPSGTKHVLGELKIAKIVSQNQKFGFKDADLVAMVTSNAGDMLARCWSRQVGRLLPGSFGDITVFRPRGNGDVWSQIVNATEREVMLVVAGGIPRYGDTAIMKAIDAPPSSSVQIASTARSVAIPDPKDPKKGWEWTDIVARLDAVRKDPVSAVHRAEGLRRSYAGPMTATDAPLQLALDMPTGGMLAFAGRPPDMSKVVIPPLPSLVHDKAFFTDIHGQGFHRGILDGLADFYAE